MKESSFIEYLKVIVPTVISLVAAIFSILAYRRNRRIENENYIFKTKQENYSKILLELGNTIDNLQKYIDLLTHFLKEMHELNDGEIDEVKDKIDDMADKVDDLIFDFENVVIANSLVTPKGVLEKLDNLCDMLVGTDIPSTDDKNLNEILKKLDNELTNIINSANEINEVMRSDLNVEELNFLLYKRIKK